MLNKLFDSNVEWDIPFKGHPGAFGAIRKYDIHQGVDIYVPHNTPVCAVEQCIVMDVYWFTGSNSNLPTPWWNNTQAVLVYNRFLHNYFIYGETTTDLEIGDIVAKGELIGYVDTVLKTDKGKPMSMLHFEVWKNKPINYKPWVPWIDKNNKPKYLCNPTRYLMQFKEEYNDK
jgi:murein DD-endopeptidase MepM/ murein hydrolase activator NlpD